MKKKKKDLLHIQVKDNGLILSEKIGNQLSSVKAELQKGIIDKLISGSDTKSITRYKIAQNNELRDFRIQTHKVIDSTKKSVKTALKSDTTVNLTDKQINRTSKTIDKGLLFLEKSAVETYQKTLNTLFLKVKSADNLKDELQKHINSGVEVGVIYKDGRRNQFDSYFEMKARTDIQQDIGKNMVEAGNAAGVIFYIAAFFGDCAKDHVDYQGKIYVDKDWEASAPADRVDEIRSYISTNNIKTVQEIMDAPYYFTTRPNCRHYFQYVDIDSVLGAKTDRQVSNLRNKMNLNFNGKYRPEKYEALQQQRANERKIRQKKEEVSKYEQSLALDVGNKELRMKILNGEASIRHYQAKQRELEKNYDNIERSYMREQVGGRVDFNVSKNLTTTLKSGNIKVNSGLRCVAKDFYVEPLDEKEFNKLKSKFEDKGGVFIQDDEAQEYLKFRNADALTLNSTTILLKPKPTASEVHEELIHAEQMAKGKCADPTNKKEKLECEIEASQILIQNKEKFMITDKEHEYNKKRLEQELKDLKEGNYDKY